MSSWLRCAYSLSQVLSLLAVQVQKYWRSLPPSWLPRRGAATSCNLNSVYLLYYTSTEVQILTVYEYQNTNTDAVYHRAHSQAAKVQPAATRSIQKGDNDA
jgi:hypothetical protein